LVGGASWIRHWQQGWFDENRTQKLGAGNRRGLAAQAAHPRKGRSSFPQNFRSKRTRLPIGGQKWGRKSQNQWNEFLKGQSSVSGFSAEEVPHYGDPVLEGKQRTGLQPEIMVEVSAWAGPDGFSGWRAIAKCCVRWVLSTTHEDARGKSTEPAQASIVRKQARTEVCKDFAPLPKRSGRDKYGAPGNPYAFAPMNSRERRHGYISPARRRRSAHTGKRRRKAGEAHLVRYPKR